MSKKISVMKILAVLVTAGMIASVFGTVNLVNDTGGGGPGSSSGALSSSGNNTIVRIIESGNYSIVEDSEGVHDIDMALPGYWDMTSPGNPALPQAMMEILVPNNIDWSTVTMNVIIVESYLLNDSYNIAPSPPLEAEVSEIDPKLDHEVDWGYDKIILEEKNILVYENDDNFPEESIEMIPYTQRKEGIRLKFINANSRN